VLAAVYWRDSGEDRLVGCQEQLEPIATRDETNGLIDLPVVRLEA
jgi:hypothetical protein